MLRLVYKAFLLLLVPLLNLNNVVWDPEMGFFSVESTCKTLQGYESINMLRKEQMHTVVNGDITGQVTFIFGLYEGVA